MAKNYWLFKSEPDVFSWDDLVAEPNRTTYWEGVRNYQARNLLRDEIKEGDGVLYYHSNAKPQVIVGQCRVTRSGYPDPVQFDPKHKYYDPKATKEKPRWYVVDIQAEKPFSRPISLPELKERDDLDGLMLTKKGSRLSVQPVSAEHWKLLSKLGKPTKL